MFEYSQSDQPLYQYIMHRIIEIFFVFLVFSQFMNVDKMLSFCYLLSLQFFCRFADDVARLKYYIHMAWHHA